jgi:hypothetical protein
MDNYDEKFLNRFIEILEKAKDSKKTIIIDGDFLQRIRFLISKQKYYDILDEKMEDIGISGLVIELDARDITNLKLEMNYDIFRRNVIIKPALIQDNTLPNKNKEENNMLKILEIYKEKKTREIEHKYDEQLLELECNDPINAVIEEAEEKLREMLETDKVMISVNSDTVNLTPETIEKRKVIIDIIHKEKEELNNVIREIEALLEFAPNYEESTKILLAYDIIDKKGKIK